MRYILQVIVMFSDLIIIGVSSIAVYLTWNSFPANVLVLFLVLGAYKSWQNTGGFMAWNVEAAKRFLSVAKKAGL